MIKKIRSGIYSAAVFILALILLFEEWVWDLLKPILEYLSRFRIIQRLEKWISGLDPYPALSIFLVPLLIERIIEFGALGFFATGKIKSGALVYILSKAIGFMIVTRIFTLTKENLMKVKWFKTSYDWFIEKKDWLYGLLEEMEVWKTIKRLKGNMKLMISRIKSEFSGKSSFFGKAKSESDKMKEMIRKGK